MKKTRRVQKLRPTSSLVKNALFNILGNIEDLAFLDLFAGTGQIGLEAERRGAQVIYVEKNPSRVLEIKKKAKGKVIRGDALKVLDRLDIQPNIIFADPPYNFEEYELLIHKSLKALAPGGLFILEHDKRKEFQADEVRIYGDTALSFWRKKE
ncbi:16S rRNA (guanine(966)-N(2))-methyltransferase RsmD [Hydrogenivirga caldilitoris]|uniref:16S rRNA (Guanine(966)-N(2))-methyltransferase RsmD n=1 Tax=Hydrogenivirga caldilitoris TaxID=246264 RepID=A0A497XQJ2_9AQUI|nr:RsmD family RNA methyltransferase [Hydrogenivirga caldilitoris]RLJ71158.1 16S rRNA (guanine(966)-N(2))-methyltransferase RsmD [Hydrogenivirga caldilitoris]